MATAMGWDVRIMHKDKDGGDPTDWLKPVSKITSSKPAQKTIEPKGKPDGAATMVAAATMPDIQSAEINDGN